MKNKLTVIFIACLAVGAILIEQLTAQVSTNASHQLYIETVASTNLNAQRIRVTSGTFVLDQDPSKWQVEFNIECWRTNGATKIISTETLTLTMAELKAAINAGSPLNALKTAVKAKVGLIEKP